jgi:hypothetical protein
LPPNSDVFDSAGAYSSVNGVVADAQLERMVVIRLGHRPDAVVREERLGVEHGCQDARQLLRVDDRKPHAIIDAPLRHVAESVQELGTILREPSQALAEVAEAADRSRSATAAAKIGINPRSSAREWELAAVGQPEDVVVVAVLLVPQPLAVAARVIDGGADVHEVLEELRGDVLVHRVLLGELQREAEEIEAIHRHPARAVGLLEVAPRRQPDVRSNTLMLSRPEEAALEDVVAFGVLAVDPPREVDEQLLEDALEELAVGAAVELLLDLVDAHRGPRVHRRIDVAERPLVRGIWPLGCMYHSRVSRISWFFAKSGSIIANAIAWNAMSQAANQGYSHLSASTARRPRTCATSRGCGPSTAMPAAAARPDRPRASARPCSGSTACSTASRRNAWRCTLRMSAGTSNGVTRL